MGAVDTTYTFTATDTITSTKMNNIIDQTTMTTDAIIGTTLDISSGKLRVRSGGITANEMGTGSVLQSAIGSNVVGTGPAFSAVIAAGQVVSAGTGDTKVILTENFDFGNNFANSRFTAPIAGVYSFSASTGGVGNSGTTSFVSHSAVYVNGARRAIGSFVPFAGDPGGVKTSSVSLITYLNVGDYVELFYHQTSNGGGSTITYDGSYNYFSGCLIRSA